MGGPLNHLYEFESFRLDAETGTLWRGDEVVSLSPKAAEVLKLLVSRNGQIVSKREIFDAIWADTFVEDGVLTQNIYTLRHALGRDKSGKQLIETVPRRGYRFAGPITVVRVAEKSLIASDSVPAILFERYDDDASSADHGAESPRRIVPYPDSDSVVITESPFDSISLSSLRIPILAGAAITLLAAAALGIYFFLPRNHEASPQSSIAPIEQVRFQSLTDTGDIIHPTISPDGEILAFVRTEGEQSSVWIQQISNVGSAVQTLPSSRKGYRSLVFSTDGKFLFFRDEADPGSIYQTNRLGGTPKKVAENVWSDFSISPDNTRFAFVRRDPKRNAHLLVLSNVNDGGERVLAERTLPNGYRGPAPAWSPDGKKMAVAVASSVEARPVISEVDVASGQETELKTPTFREITRILWTPDGKQFIVAARLVSEATSQIWTLSIPDGEVRRLTNDLEAYFWLSLSADGRTLIARQQRINAHLWLLPDGDLKRAKQLTSGGRTLDGYVGLTWTPDNRVIFSSRAGEATDLYSIDPEKDQRVQLTANAGSDNNWPAVSNDGRYVVFVSSRSGARAIWRTDADGVNTKQLTFGEAPKESAFAPAISPDGNEIYFIKVGGEPSSIWKTSIDGENETKVSKLVHAAAENFLSISPDGKWLAYQHVSESQGNRSEDASAQIGVVAADGSGEPMLFDAPMRRPVFHWTSNNAFDYAGGTFNSSSLWRQEIGGTVQKLLDFPDRIFNFAWSRDGKHLVVSRGRLRGDAVLITNLP